MTAIIQPAPRPAVITGRCPRCDRRNRKLRQFVGTYYDPTATGWACRECRGEIKRLLREHDYYLSRVM